MLIQKSEEPANHFYADRLKDIEIEVEVATRILITRTF